MYIVYGFHNQNYEGLFARLYENEAAMISEVDSLMAADMSLSTEKFHDLMENNKEEFDESFLDGSNRTYEECMDEGAYYSEKGYEIAWGEIESEA